MSSLSMSALTLKNENTFALAAANFNFSLVTIEPPEEYRMLGKQLSSKRRAAAEEGSVHITARKLGALFEQLIQPTPDLIKAYGQRVSEISESPVANPKGTDKHGIFRDHVGADGTTIWAAATSGKSAMAMNLLACFLARIWSSSEAIAIWVELVESRQKEIMDSLDGSEPSHLAPIAAAKQTISKDELAEWDAGARAWLRAGDVVKKREMKQLNLIINNLEMSVGASQNVYTSVVRAWKTAMNTIDKLISGISYSIEDGAVLLALSSWHIYPDMLVLGAKEKYVSQKDPLIPSKAYITIGIQTQTASLSTQNGVYWSLSLARLRRYGSPVKSTRCSETDLEKISFDEFLFVFLGSFFAKWKKITTDWLLAAEFMTIMWEAISDEAASSNSGSEKAKEIVADSSSWIALLYRTSRALLDSQGEARTEAMQLVKAGARPSNDEFLGRSKDIAPAFGLTELSNYYSLLPRDERYRELLKYTRERRRYRKRDLLNAYANTRSASQKNGKNPTAPLYARARAIHVVSRPNPAENREFELELFKFTDKYSLISQSKGGEISYFWVGGSSRPHFSSLDLGSRPRKENFDIYTRQEFEEMRSGIDGAAQTFTEFYISTIHDEEDFRIVADDPIVLSLYHRLVLGPRYVPLREVVDAFKLKRLSTQNLINYLNHTWPGVDKQTREEYTYPLQLMASAAKLYKLLPGATVSIRATEFSVSAIFRFYPRLDRSRPHYSDKFSAIDLFRPLAFAIVALFGGMVSCGDPHTLSNTMAVSIDDSLYVAASFLCDPSEAPENYELRRVTGNIGQPGVSFMVSLNSPEIKKSTLGNWKQISHNDYDGIVQDSFQSTSLHLSFTGYRRSIAARMFGREAEAYFLETVVSVYDRGDWVGDVDILRAFKSRDFYRLPSSRNCSHSPKLPATVKPISIDNWDELLEKPKEQLGIVRANGNWLSRLAATALSIQSGNKTAVLCDEPCWECYTTATKAEASELDEDEEDGDEEDGDEEDGDEEDKDGNDEDNKVDDDDNEQDEDEYDEDEDNEDDEDDENEDEDDEDEEDEDVDLESLIMIY